MSEPFLQVRDLCCRMSGVSILERVSFDVGPGELVAVMGRNGAGKSTLLDALAGIRSAQSGAVHILGRPFEAWSPLARARTLAHLPQQPRAELSMRAEALVLMGRYAHATGWLESVDDERVAREAMRRCGCLDLMDRVLATLSGGERQRVLLAACVAQGARLLLLDEPGTFLDADQQAACFSVLRAEADRGVGCIAVTHDANLALAFCTRILVLAGRTVAHDLPVAAALHRADWLRGFSDRLELARGEDGRAWARYRDAARA